MKKRELSESERHVIIDKGTEMPFSGKYWNNRQPGTYVCRQCGTPLYRSADKFDAGCGWPSFDDAIPGAVIRRPDADGIRTEIVCAGLRRPSRPRLYRRKIHPEEHPPLRQFHIVGIHSGDTVRKPQTATKRLFSPEGVSGVWNTTCKRHPALSPLNRAIRAAASRHLLTKRYAATARAMLKRYGSPSTRRRPLTKRSPASFFEIHDPEQVNRQGPDIGRQYRSEIFYNSEAQHRTAERLIDELVAKGYDIATRLSPAGPFWKAEDYHQNYYERKGTTPYCHRYTRRF